MNTRSLSLSFVYLLLLIIALVGMLNTVGRAQTAPAPAAAAASAPKLSEDDTLMIQGVVAVGQVANEACQGLDSVKRYQQQMAQVSARIETKYTGFRFNWTSGVLEAKAAPAAAK